MSTFANALAFLALGVVVYGVSLLVLLRALPGNLWKQAVEDQNTSAAIVVAGIALALGCIVAAAVH